MAKKSPVRMIVGIGALAVAGGVIFMMMPRRQAAPGDPRLVGHDPLGHDALPAPIPGEPPQVVSPDLIAGVPPVTGQLPPRERRQAAPLPVTQPPMGTPEQRLGRARQLREAERGRGRQAAPLPVTQPPMVTREQRLRRARQLREAERGRGRQATTQSGFGVRLRTGIGGTWDVGYDVDIPEVLQ